MTLLFCRVDAVIALRYERALRQGGGGNEITIINSVMSVSASGCRTNALMDQSGLAFFWRRLAH